MKYVFEYKKTVKERNFIASKNCLEAANPEESVMPVYFAMDQRSADQVRYHAEMTVQQGVKVSTVKGPVLTFPMQNGYTALGFTPETLGIEIVSVDFQNLMFFNEAEELTKELAKKEQPKMPWETPDSSGNPESTAPPREPILIQEEPPPKAFDPKDYPLYITITLSHGQRKVTLKGISDIKDAVIAWPVAKDGTPVTCKIVGKFKNSPQTREYIRNQEQDLRTGASSLDLIIGNDDFEK